MNSIGIFNHVQSSAFTAATFDLKVEAQAMFAQSAYTAISCMHKEQKELLGLANLTAYNPHFQTSSAKITLAIMAKATFIWKQWQTQEGLKPGMFLDEAMIAKALEAEMQSERVIEWAILAEATLTAILRMSRKQVEVLGILASMKETLIKLWPVFKGVSSQIAGAVTKPALQLALDMLFRKPSPGKPGYPSMYPIEATTKPAPWPPAREDNGLFLNRLFSELDARHGVDDFGTLKRPRFGGPTGSSGAGGDVLPTANWGSAGSSIINQRMLQGLPMLIPKGHPGAELKPDVGAPPLDGIAERAMLAEAALAAVLKVPLERFDARFWKTVTATVVEIAPVVIVIRAAPSVYANVGRVVQGLRGPCPCCQIQPVGPAAAGASTGALGSISEPWSPSSESGYLPWVKPVPQ